MIAVVCYLWDQMSAWQQWWDWLMTNRRHSLHRWHSLQLGKTDRWGFCREIATIGEERGSAYLRVKWGTTKSLNALCFSHCQLLFTRHLEYTCLHGMTEECIQLWFSIVMHGWYCFPNFCRKNAASTRLNARGWLFSRDTFSSTE